MCTYAYTPCQLPKRIQGGSIQLIKRLDFTGRQHKLWWWYFHRDSGQTPIRSIYIQRRDVWCQTETCLLTLLMCILWILNKRLRIVELPPHCTSFQQSGTMQRGRHAPSTSSNRHCLANEILDLSYWKNNLQPFGLQTNPVLGKSNNYPWHIKYRWITIFP